jgi:hypothetical protein
MISADRRFWIGVSHSGFSLPVRSVGSGVTIFIAVKVLSALLLSLLAALCAGADVVKPADSARRAWFGQAMAFAGDSLIAGAPGADGGAGAVYLFARHDGRWSELTKFRPQDVQADFAFGSGIVAEGMTIAVSAPGAPTRTSGGDVVDVIEPGALEWSRAAVVQATGVVYILELVHDHFELKTKLVPPDPHARMGFGSKLAMRDGELLVAAPGAKSIFVYDRAANGQWTLASAIHADATTREFGESVAFCGNRIAAWHVDDGYNRSIRLFERHPDGWAVAGSLRPVGDPMVSFSDSMTCHADWLAVGGRLLDDVPSSIAAGYFFTMHDGQWQFHERIESTDGKRHFARHVASSGDLVVATGWKELRVYRVADAALHPLHSVAQEVYAASLAISPHWIAICVLGDDGSGAVHVFPMEP